MIFLRPGVHIAGFKFFPELDLQSYLAEFNARCVRMDHRAEMPDGHRILLFLAGWWEGVGLHGNNPSRIAIDKMGYIQYYLFFANRCFTCQLHDGADKVSSHTSVEEGVLFYHS